jgi:geranylgeranyl diphosphate synthase type I
MGESDEVRGMFGAGPDHTNTMTASVAAPRNPSEILLWARVMVDPALRAAVDSLPGSMRRIAGYHFGWWDADERPASDNPGKALRPGLTLVTAQAVGGSAAAVAAIPAAVAVELVHNFSLLQDDVMDRDTSRRHRATAWTVFGTSSAILAGDSLLTLAFDVLAGTPGRNPDAMTHRLTTAVQALVEGQAQDISFEHRMDVTIAECRRMLGLKTAALFACACAMGALAACATRSVAERYHRYGNQLGFAFQFADDLLGIWGDPAVTGKPAHADLAVGKKSAPVVAALASGTPEGGELAELYRRAKLTPAELARAAALVEAAGGREWSRDQAAASLTRALRELRPDGFDAELRSLAALAAWRDQ